MDMYGNYPPEIMSLSVSERADLWIIAGETGISSRTIWAVMRGVNVDPEWEFFDRASFYPPSDPADFRRCYLLLRLIPEWRKRLWEIPLRFPWWNGVIWNWDELTALYEQERENPDGNAPLLYERMKKLTSFNYQKEKQSWKAKRNA